MSDNGGSSDHNPRRASTMRSSLNSSTSRPQTIHGISLSSRRKARSFSVNDAGANCLKAMVASFAVEGVDSSLEHQRECCKMLNQITYKNSENKDTCIDAGAVEIVCKAMRQYPRDRKLQRFGCGALGNLASRDSRAVVQAQGMEYVVAAMHEFPTEEKIQFNAIRALKSLTITGKTRRRGKADGENSCEDELRQSYLAKLLELEGETLLSTAVENFHEQNETLINCAVEILLALEDHLGRVGESGEEEEEYEEMQPVEEEEQTQPAKVQSSSHSDRNNNSEQDEEEEQTMSTLGTSTVHTSETAATKAAVASLASFVDHLFRGKNAKVAVETLLSMDLGRKENAELRSGFDNTGICQSVVAGMESCSTDKDLQVTCCKLVVDLTYSHSANKQEFLRAGVAEHIVAAMRQFPNDATIQFRACRALRNLLSGADENKQCVVAANGIEAILLAMQTTLRNLRADDSEQQCLLEEAAAALSNASTKREYCQRILNQGAKDLLGLIVEHHEDLCNEKIVKYSSRALSRIEQSASV